MRAVLYILALLPFVVPGHLPIEETLPPEPSISAKAYVLYDANSEKMLCSELPDRQLPMASTTKLMTGYVALKLSGGNLQRRFTVSREATLAEGTRIYLREDERPTLEELLYGLLLASGNDAAIVLAEGLCGSVAAFVKEMNACAAALGLKNTAFKNPHGLPAEGHYSTARDMAVLMAQAMKMPEFAKITGTREKAFTNRTVVNHNRLIGTYPDMDGGKTGFTTAAGRCLVTTVLRNGRRLVAVTLNAPDDWDDHKMLYEYGFKLFKNTELIAPGRIAPELTVVGGMTEKLTLCVKESASAMLTAGELRALETAVYLPRFCYAPVKAGQEVGRVVFSVAGRELASVAIYTEYGVAYRNKK